MNHEPDGEPIPFTPEEQDEFDAWEKLGDEAWSMIDEWEKEERRVLRNSTDRVEARDTK